MRESAERLLRCTEKPGIGNAGGVVTDDVIRFAITGSHGISEIRHVLNAPAYALRRHDGG